MDALFRTDLRRQGVLFAYQANNYYGSRYGSPRFFSGEPELGLTTLSGELELELTTPTGFTIKMCYVGIFIGQRWLLWLTTFLSGEPELELTTPSGELVLELITPIGFTKIMFIIITNDPRLETRKPKQMVNRIRMQRTRKKALL